MEEHDALVVRWENPPATKYLRKWARIAAELKIRPGEWALIVEGVTQKYGYDAVTKSLRRLGCEVRTRSVEGLVSVWARWPA